MKSRHIYALCQMIEHYCLICCLQCAIFGDIGRQQTWETCLFSCFLTTKCTKLHKQASPPLKNSKNNMLPLVSLIGWQVNSNNKMASIIKDSCRSLQLDMKYKVISTACIRPVSGSWKKSGKLLSGFWASTTNVIINNNNNNNKTCNAHISTLLGVQGAVKPKTKQKQNKNKT